MELSVLASGSAGNSIYISDGRSSLLVDAGLSMRKMEARLEAIGRRPQDLGAVLLTHEHSDHVSGAPPLCRRHRLPLYCSATVRDNALGRYGDFGEVRTFEPGAPFAVGTLRVQPFGVPHDALEPVCFVVSSGSASVAVVTDLGCPTHLVRQKLRQCQIVVLEFNHDPDLLKKCSYPWRVKQRILSRVGHLSNETAAELLESVVHPGLRRVVLAHLSEKNNHPELARMHAEGALRAAPAVQLSVASQHEPTELYEVPHEQPIQAGLFDEAPLPRLNVAS
jgi:phosphoribosyl 1,2-cyclic phosphodiesterase